MPRIPLPSHVRKARFGQRLAAGLIGLIILATATGNPPVRGQELNDGPAFRALAVACDLPDGLQLTINNQSVPVVYPSGKVTNLSAFRPGSYSVRAESSDCLPAQWQLDIKPGTIHTWIFYTEPVPETETDKPVADTNEKVAPRRVLMFRDITTPSKITKPATVLIDLTGTPGGISVLLDGKPVGLTPAEPAVLPPRQPGATLELARPGRKQAPFFSGKIEPGNHTIIAVFRKRNGQLAAVMKIL